MPRPVRAVCCVEVQHPSVPVADPPHRLAAALADRYRIGREVGTDGMATVYLAEELRHHRQVALKVLKPEIAAVLGPTRFLRETHTTAQLTHLHILPLHDSGEAAGFLCVMPYVEGESLGDRLAREKRLPLDDGESKYRLHGRIAAGPEIGLVAKLGAVGKMVIITVYAP